MVRNILLIFVSIFSFELTNAANTLNMDGKRQRELVELGREFNITVNLRTISTLQARRIFKMRSYCSCMCCREAVPDDVTSGAACDRTFPVSLPADFACPQTFCLKNFEQLCDAWDQSKCDRTCFCRRCEGKLPDTDYRCSDNAGSYVPGPMCDCDAIEFPPKCEEEQKDLQNLWLAVTLLPRSQALLDCVYGCFCNNCDIEEISRVIPTAKSICRARQHLPSPNCPCPSCPTESSAIQARMSFQSISISQAVHGKK